MKKLLSLIKATMKGNMGIFNIKSKNGSKYSKFLLPLFLTIILLFSFGYYALTLAIPLSKVNLTYILLSLFMIGTIAIILMEGVYKIQGIIFASKDNDLLFSLPIPKYMILFSRVLKLLAFEYIFNAFILLPAIAIYSYLVSPAISFYLITFIMFILLPLIPTILVCIIGYLIEGLSSLFKNKKIIQTIFTIIYTVILFYFILNINDIFANIVAKAESINDLITKIYYPIGLYINLISNFKISDFIILILIHIVPFILFIYLLSISYFKIIGKSNIIVNNTNHNNKKTIISCKKPVTALVIKEIKRFFSSPIYIFNTIFGIVLFLVMATVTLFNPNVLSDLMNSIDGIQVTKEMVSNFIPLICIGSLVLVCTTVTITASSISLEGKSYNVTKSLPISAAKILLSKIIASNIITIPLLLISNMFLFLSFNINIKYIILILIITFLYPIFLAMIDLIINLKYPKMDFSSDIEVVKQSASTLISMILNMGILIFLGAIMMYLSEYMDYFLTICLIILLLIISIIILWLYIRRRGSVLFQSINV